MAYSSPLYKDELIIDDSTSTGLTHPRQFSRGLDLSPRPREGYAYGGSAEPFPSSLIIPQSEWQARIEERDAKKARLSDIILQAGIPSHDQDGVPYCWIHGPTGAVEVIRAVQNQEKVLLSATSAGAIIKNFRKEGGWGKEGLQYIADKGIMPQSLWPENTFDRSKNTPENWAIGAKYRCTEWWELKPRNHEEMVSCVLGCNTPVAVGLNWWGHEVYVCDVVWQDGTAVLRIRNSWTDSWGDKGFSILKGSKMLADDAVCPRVMKAA